MEPTPTTDLELAQWLLLNTIIPYHRQEGLNRPDDWNYKFINVVLYFVDVMRSMGFSYDQIQSACRRSHDERMARAEARRERLTLLREDDLEQWWNRHSSE